MCGIMGYIGDRSARNIIHNGLQRLEYRGYDSAGIAVLGKKVEIVKALGDTSNLQLETMSESANLGIGHTRWATHGMPSERNAHPHAVGSVVLVHNGIIENYEDLKALIDTTKLKSQTDSEVLAALIDTYSTGKKTLLEATKQALAEVRGTFGIAVFSTKEPGRIITARRGSPLVIGVGEDQHYIASDPVAIIDHTDKVVYLEDDQIAVISAADIELYDLKLSSQNLTVETLENTAQKLDKNGFDSFFQKEIFEQPDSLRNVMLGRVSDDDLVKLGGPLLSAEDVKSIKNILIIGCGTAYYAAYYVKYELEEMLNIPVQVEHASEFRYRYGAYDAKTTLAIFMSQSGETADTIASLREAKRRGIKSMGIVNSVGSTLAREVTHGGIYLHAGVESSVASTKAYSSMVVALLMFGGQISYMLGRDARITQKVASELRALPQEIERTLDLWPAIERVAQKITRLQDWFFLGRGSLYPVALEGALKITEVAYVHAQAFPTGEMKHGPIALINQKHLCILLLPEDELLYKKSVSTLEEIKSRSGKVLTISTRPKEQLSDFHIEISHLGSHVDGLLYAVCVQLLTLGVATKKNVNIDRPKNLAKSVTVE